MKPISLNFSFTTLFAVVTSSGLLLQTAFCEELKPPVTISSQSKVLKQDVYVQFAKAKVSGTVDAQGRPITEIWTRAYSTRASVPNEPAADIVPGPTFVFHPDDLLEITLHNQLNRDANPWLREFEENIARNGTKITDEIEEFIPHELNIPHNADNTNLHVHGLHVDPKKDNVTLLILPEDSDPSLIPPDLQSLVPNIDRWWEWQYSYKIPRDHMPGTHWFHAHKHGATSTHVENGMAGTLIMAPSEREQDVLPFLWQKEGLHTRDRVMVIQEIANYGVQQGKGKERRHAHGGPSPEHQSSSQDNTTLDWPDITVNGQHQPLLSLAPNQIERWRVVEAGANHRIASYLYVARLNLPEAIPADLLAVLKTVTNFQAASNLLQVGSAGLSATNSLLVTLEPFDGVVKLGAIDGVNFNQAVDITPESPVVVGAGNRADLYVQPSAKAKGTYYLCKNFNIAPPLDAFQKTYAKAYPGLFEGQLGRWRYDVLVTTSLTNGSPTVINQLQGKADAVLLTNLSGDPYGLNADYVGYKRPWPNRVDQKGEIVSKNINTNQSLVPLLKGKLEGGLLTVAPVAAGGSLPGKIPFPSVGWQTTSSGASLVDDQVLLTLEVKGSPVTPEMDLSKELDAQLNLASPGTSLDLKDPQQRKNFKLRELTPDQKELIPGIPGYVHGITDQDIEGHQVIIFDRSGVTFNYLPPDQSGSMTINQFTLNGRQFSTHDSIGSHHATRGIQTPVTEVVLNPYSANQSIGTNSFTALGSVSNYVKQGEDWMGYYTNPGYYVPIIQKKMGDQGYYTYDNAGTLAPIQAPNFTDLTGLEHPEMPQATTAQEWLLINNSKIFHPFHIHINPFLVMEIGQLDYNVQSEEWKIKRLAESDSPLKWVENKWWDTIIIPPQGYVRIRFWVNIPDQKPANPKDPNSREWVVKENANIYGSWVYHCHILRHEDRGMMMMVNVNPKPEVTPAKPASHTPKH